MIKQVVFTGAPGAGKTTIWEDLRQSNFDLVAESARIVLSKEGGRLLRKNDEFGFSTQCIDLDKESLRQLDRLKKVTIFDRGLGDSLAYFLSHGKPIPGPLRQFSEQYRYSGPIIVFPPWEEIYHRDDLRIQTYAEAVASCSIVTAAWHEIGYDTIEIPKMSVQDRLSWIRGIMN